MKNNSEELYSHWELLGQCNRHRGWCSGVEVAHFSHMDKISNLLPNWLSGGEHNSTLGATNSTSRDSPGRTTVGFVHGVQVRKV